MLTVQEIAVRFGVTEHTVLEWLHSGQLRGVNVGRHPDARKPRWRISEEALAEFEALRTPTPPQPRARRRNRPNDVIEFIK